MKRKKWYWIASLLLAVSIIVLTTSLYLQRRATAEEGAITKEGNLGTSYQVRQNAGETITITSKNLATGNITEMVSTKDMPNTIDLSYQAAFWIAEKSLHTKLLETTTQQLSVSTMTSFEETYAAFIPYETIVDGRIGVFVKTNDQKIFSALQKKPSQAADYADGKTILLEQAIVIE